MIVYVESSAVLAWLLQEPGHERVLAVLREAEKVASSRLTLLESERTVARRVAETRIAASEAVAAREALADAAMEWALLDIDSETLDLARMRFPVEPVRSLDAIHLASAMQVRNGIPDVAFASLDARIRENAVRLGFAVLP